MPPVILWALGAIGAATIGRWLYRESRRVNAELYPADQPPDDRASARQLERDPHTGVYRPK